MYTYVDIQPKPTRESRAQNAMTTVPSPMAHAGGDPLQADGGSKEGIKDTRKAKTEKATELTRMHLLAAA